LRRIISFCQSIFIVHQLTVLNDAPLIKKLLPLFAIPDHVIQVPLYDLGSPASNQSAIPPVDG